MIQSAASSSAQKSLGFEKLARFGPQPAQAGGSGRSEKMSAATAELTLEQQRQVAELKQIDLKVRAHEQAHMSAGAGLIRGGASFSYETGPDNKRYAVAGEVSIDTSPGRTPEETIPKAQHIRAAALAPADPSPQDHGVAAQASQMEGQARQEVSAKQREESTTALYQGNEKGHGNAGQLGSRLDLFA